jgi:hypothetical protein
VDDDDEGEGRQRRENEKLYIRCLSTHPYTSSLLLVVEGGGDCFSGLTRQVVYKTFSTRRVQSCRGERFPNASRCLLLHAAYVSICHLHVTLLYIGRMNRECNAVKVVVSYRSAKQAGHSLESRSRMMIASCALFSSRTRRRHF